MVLRPNRQNRLEVHWDGPAEVIQRISDVNYSVRLPGRRQEERVYHVNLMKPFFERTEIVSIALNVLPEVPVEVPSCERKVNPSVEEIVLGAVDKSAIDDEQVRNLEVVIQEFLECFAAQPGKTHMITHDIELTSEVPF